MRKIAPILLIVLALVAGCKKHYPLAADTNLVKTIAYHNQPPSEFLWYDAMGRVTVDSIEGRVYRYVYSGDSITWINSLDTQTFTYTYYLNAQGLLFYYGAEYYYYDNLGENTMIVSSFDTTIIVWSHGDMVKRFFVGATDTATYTYYTQADNRNFGQQYLGRLSYHLISSNSSGENFSYTFDSQGRVSSMTISINTTDRSVTTYTYY